jgi:serine/threonine-protein kinase
MIEGTRLGRYEIRSPLGAGGMGEVYLADDTRLRRKVALKVLPEAIAADTDRLLRFEREAFAASALNHPNILTIFEFGVENSTHFLAAEFVDGESLRERMNRSTVTLTETLEIGIQIASALQAAHGAGIIHRDIKPDNVMIRADGYVKVLDFGLAKLSEPGALATGFISDPEAQTRMQLQTQAGMIMGTVAYMSPEQARGQAVDRRTDVWSLGCVLYEMLTRQQPFRGETIADALANIIHREPAPLLTLRQDANAELERIINLTLAKDMDERYQTAKDVLADLKQLQKRLEFEAELERSSSSSIKTESQTQVIRAPTTPETTTRNSIAVLPFSNLSADPDNEYFCDGLAEELLNALAKIDHLKVAARTSAFSFKGKNANVSEIGQKLSVKTVLEGSVRRSGNRLRITVQLVNASDGYHLWSERYDREMQDIFDVQDEITLAILDALKLKLFNDEKVALLKRYTDNPEAYQLYLQGRYCYNKYTPEYFQKGIEYFEQAIELEPEYAPAYAGLGFCYGAQFYFGGLAPDQVVPKLKALTSSALRIDDSLADAYLSRASVEFYFDWDFDAAESDHQRAIELNPNSPDAYWRYGHFLALCGRFDDGIRFGERAVELDPLSLVAQFFLARIYLLSQRVDKGFAVLRKMEAIEPNFAGIFTQSGGLLLQTGKYDEAIEAYKKALTLGHFVVPAMSYLGAAYGVAGKRDDAYEIVDQLIERNKAQYVPPFCIARVYSALGENDKAFEWFEKAFAERSGEMVALKREALAGLMGSAIIRDDRFQDLVRRVGMPMDRPAPNKDTSEASETHTVVFDSAEHRSGRAGSSSPGVTVSPLSHVATVVDDAGDRSPAAKAPTSRRPPHSPRRKSLLIIALIIFIVALATGGYRFFANRGVQINSIAVMPFVNAGGNADLEYLSDGMTETLISSLSQLPNLNVKARSSVFRYKGKETNPQTIGKELSVQAILNGRVVQRGDQLTLTLELIDAQTENVIWSEQYNRKQSDLTTLQSDIARDVLNKLKVKLSGADERKLAKTYTTNADAYKLYLQGRFYWNKREERDFRKAVEFYNQAIALDPNYALAYAGQADTYALLSTFGFMPPTEGVPKAREFARQAVSLDETLAEPHTTLGYLSLTYDYDFAGSEREFRRAIELNPNYATAHQWFGEMLLNAGRFDEASIEYRRALELEPLSLPINWDFGRFLYMSRRYDESLAQHKKTIELDPGFARAHRTLAEVYRVKGDYANAVEERAKVLDLIGQPENAALIRATFARDGWLGFLRLVTAENSSLKDINNNWVVAKAYVDLGQKDKAFAELDKAYEKRLSSLCWLKIEPQMDPLRSDPRYTDLLRKMNFPK